MPDVRAAEDAAVHGAAGAPAGVTPSLLHAIRALEGVSLQDQTVRNHAETRRAPAEHAHVCQLRLPVIRLLFCGI